MKKKILFVIILLSVFVGRRDCMASRIYLATDTVIKYSPIIIEGNVIDVTPAYWVDKTIYTSYIIQVYKVFKGNMTKKYIEIPMRGGQIGNQIIHNSSCGSLHLTGKGRTGIFFLSLPNKLDTVLNKKFHNSGDSIAGHFIVHPNYDVLSYGGYGNVEKNIYQHIESLTGQKRKIISRPEVKDKNVREWLMTSDRTELLDKVGMTLKFSHEELNPRQKTFDLWVNLKSNVLYTDLHSIEFAIKYNSETFGTYVVKNKTVEFNNPNRYHRWKGEPVSALLIGDSAYQTNITDLDSSTVLISIKSTNKEKGGFQFAKKGIALMCFKIKDFNSQTQFSFIPNKAKGKYYDYENSQISSLSYVYCGSGLDVLPHSYKTPFVSNFSPDSIKCGESETLTINGIHFLSDKTRVLIRCSKDQCVFYASIPSSDFISHTDTTITLNIPCKLDIGGSACGSMFPTKSGFIVDKSGLTKDSNSPRKLIIIQPD
ncbi:MAG: hypothetical protein HRT71_14580 [Flavobacteriales bacterium]|nr:hypothetical protein [Flavobacteriales bacterium]